MDQNPFLETLPDHCPPLLLHSVHRVYLYLFITVSLSLHLKPICPVCPHLRCKCPIQASESLRGKERKERWLNRTESAERGGAGITFPWLCHHKGSWVPAWLWLPGAWVRAMGLHRASQVIFILQALFSPYLIPESLHRDIMTWCECLFFGL